MASLSAKSTSLSGVASSPATAASGGDTFPNDGRTVILLKNGHGSESRTVTIDAKSANIDGLGNVAFADTTVTLTAGQSKVVGPFSTGRFNDPATGRVSLTYSDSAADITVDVFKLPNLNDL